VRHEPRCIGTKVCNKCGRTLSVLAFSAHVRHADGLCGSCRECEGDRNASLRARQRDGRIPDANWAFMGGE